VVAVTIADARAYANWKGRDLPSEAQWEWAARAARTETTSKNEQPHEANTWQGLFPVINLAEDGFAGLAPVGCYPANALGLFDMIGNVWELTADAWTPHLHAAHHSDRPDAPPQAKRSTPAAQHVIKGGSFLCAPNYCVRYRPGARQPQDTDLATSHLGFRTILRAEP
jgi:formylglycine-generating enzyme required for sulfatase activity